MKEIEIKKLVIKSLIRETKGEAIIGLEVPFCSNKRADIVSISSNNVTGYEIKSEHDEASRLTNQIKDYMNFFDYVVVVCEQSNLKEVRSYLPLRVGILVIENGKVRKIRSAKKINRHNKRSLLNSMPSTTLKKMANKKSLRSKEAYVSWLADNLTLQECKQASREQLTLSLNYKYQLFRSELGDSFCSDELQTLSRQAPSKLIISSQ